MIFENVKFAGGDFLECQFKDCVFTNCSSKPSDVSEDEYFAPMRMYRCYLYEINFNDCDFSQLTKIHCFEK